MPRRMNGAKIGLQDAVALLLHNQATFVSQMSEANRRHDELNAQIERRFAAIERELFDIKRALRDLPEATRQKIRFKTE
jgi:hypothetical protein